MAHPGHAARSLAVHWAALAALLLAGCGSKAPPQAAPDPDAVEVGYGTRPREGLTGAVGSVSTGQLDRRRVNRVEELIQGRVAGVQVNRLPGGGYSVRIRGAATIMGDGEPLYVIDGVPVRSRGGSVLDGIPPADVARIDVLKDGASAAIYGVQGANGVILITTRRND
jgi:TonB-dependent SusC/RagA subfamily outer membrane receptor